MNRLFNTNLISHWLICHIGHESGSQPATDQRSTEDTVIHRTRATDSATHTRPAHTIRNVNAACTVASWEASLRMLPDQLRAIRTAVGQSPVATASPMPRDVERISARSIDDHAREGAGRKVAVPATTGAPEGRETMPSDAVASNRNLHVLTEAECLEHT